MTALILAAVLAVDAGLPDAGTRWDDQLYGECPAAPPPVMLEDGTMNLAPARQSRNACLMVTCDERRRQLEVAPSPVSNVSLVLDLVLFGLGVVAGVVLGWQARALFFR